MVQQLIIIGDHIAKLGISFESFSIEIHAGFNLLPGQRARNRALKSGIDRFDGGFSLATDDDSGEGTRIQPKR